MNMVMIMARVTVQWWRLPRLLFCCLHVYGVTSPTRAILSKQRSYGRQGSAMGPAIWTHRSSVNIYGVSAACR